jgi:hypothetical protein
VVAELYSGIHFISLRSYLKPLARSYDGWALSSAREVQSPQAHAIADFIEVGNGSAASRLCSFGRKFRGAD